MDSCEMHLSSRLPQARVYDLTNSVLSPFENEDSGLHVPTIVP